MFIKEDLQQIKEDLEFLKIEINRRFNILDLRINEIEGTQEAANDELRGLRDELAFYASRVSGR